MTAQALKKAQDSGKTAGCPPDQHLGTMGTVAEISINLPDELVQRLQDASNGNVDAYIAALVRHELDRLRLLAFVGELEDELGPADEAEVAEFTAAFARTAAITRAMEKASDAEAETEWPRWFSTRGRSKLSPIRRLTPGPRNG